MDKKDDLRLQIVVNDEVIDLRNHNFDEVFLDERSQHKSKDNQSLKTQSKNLSQEEQRHTVNGLKKLASTLYNGPTAPLVQKHRNIIRNRQKLRTLSVDPRFRRERSPITDHSPGVSVSESLVAESCEHVETKREKATKSAHSIRLKPKFQVKTIETVENCEQIYNVELGGQKPKSYQKSKKRHSRRSEPVVPPEEEISKECEVYCPLLPPEEKEGLFVEQGTMTDECGGFDDEKVHVPNSLYETAIGDYRDKLDIGTDICPSNNTPVVSSEMQICDQISPYWDDPRLVEKYSPIIKPIPMKTSRSLWTLPLCNDQQNFDTTPETSVAPGYDCKMLTTYKYENTTDIDDASINYENAKLKLWQALWKNYNITPFFLLGSICGLGLVTLLGWILANDFLWKYFTTTKKEEKWLIYWLAYVGGGIIHCLENLFKAVSYILVMPRQDLFRNNGNYQRWDIW